MILYSDKENYQHEDAVLKFLAERWGYKHVKSIEKKSSFDGFLYDTYDVGFDKYNRPTMLVEVRRLNCTSKKHDTAMLSYTKAQSWQSIYPVLKIPVIFCVNWYDMIGWADIEDIISYGDIRVSPFSENRKNPKNDREIVFHYPVNKFNQVGTITDANRLASVGRKNETP